MISLTKPTLKNLVDDLDWTKSEVALDKWKRTASPNRDDNVGTTLGRLRLLLHALPTEIVGQIENQSDERQQAARYFLSMAGVWDQVVEWLVNHKLLGPAPEDESDQLQLNFRELSPSSH